jgi:glutamate racemase
VPETAHLTDNRPIGVFDSGIGGLTVVHELFRQLGSESVVYFGDTARVPYGTKSQSSVQRFAMQDARFLMRHDVKMIVVACHTASAMALEMLQDQIPLPVLGVTEPGIDAAVRVTRSGRIGVIGTRGTIGSGAYLHYLHGRSSDLQVFSQACPLFVPLAEEGWLDHPVTQDVAEIYLDPLKRDEIDTLILGCTHYPLLKTVLRDVMGDGVTLIDSAEETARVVGAQLGALGIAAPPDAVPGHAFFVSDIPAQFQEIGERFLGRPLGAVGQVDIEAADA